MVIYFCSLVGYQVFLIIIRERVTFTKHAHFRENTYVYVIKINIHRSRKTTPLRSVQLVQLLSHVRLFATPWIAACHVSLSITNSWRWSNSCPSSWWCHPTFLSSVIPFSSCLSFSASGSFLMSQFFTSGGQRIGVSTLASVLPMNIQDWFPLG